jgi:BirA family biotin operon repressor/biotin-[acetyl-CoA-carboxylase] ligase
VPEALTAPAVVRALGELGLGQAVYSYASVGSTNDEAKRLAEAGAPEWTLVLAEAQTAGRGRLGRRWLTAPGTALALSLVLRPALAAGHATRATLLAGVAVCEALEQVAGVPAALKWPNDLLLEGRKAGGILVETGLAGAKLDYVVVGIGLNVSQAPPPEAVLFPATCVEGAAGRPVDRLTLLRGIVERLAARYAGLDGDYGQLHADWLRRLAWVGERVVARSPEGDYHGLLAGADEDGALRVRLDGGEVRRIVVGEISLRR